ncbi:MAG: transcriptional repressor [Eubacteriales bacterium]|nr:transcriptional repressor [Eubacteriales bacterium]
MNDCKHACQHDHCHDCEETFTPPRNIEDLKLPDGLKKTRQREMILEKLLAAETPVSAADLFLALHEQDERISLSTIYRNLDALTEHKILRSVKLPGDESLYYEINSGGHIHYALCLNCRQIFALDSCPIPDQFEELEAIGFQCTGHKVEIYGYCQSCRSKIQAE